MIQHAKNDAILLDYKALGDFERLVKSLVFDFESGTSANSATPAGVT
jgi:hypothetical protein